MGVVESTTTDAQSERPYGLVVAVTWLVVGTKKGGCGAYR